MSLISVQSTSNRRRVINNMFTKKEIIQKTNIVNPQSLKLLKTGIALISTHPRAIKFYGNYAIDVYSVILDILNRAAIISATRKAKRNIAIGALGAKRNIATGALSIVGNITGTLPKDLYFGTRNVLTHIVSKTGFTAKTVTNNAARTILATTGAVGNTAETVRFFITYAFPTVLLLVLFVTLFTRGFLTKEGLVEGLSLMKTTLKGGKDITMRVAGRIFNKTVSDKRNVRPNPRITNVTNKYNSARNNE
ncbi:hypothetical protein OTV1_011 [Ostreococcus tauri virus 1]|uniref:hypothetical protein n=1 Tax=Ostreococcus tauri virus 1 TaxID=642926 RepID=UPI0001B5F531|nr:hypothetical protein OTV1_011 [Ostreococcus tauri virus 1]CAY39599.1 hypothetical protein OTV1_011 [Ostreococcus tauri virus 1]